MIGAPDTAALEVVVELPHQPSFDGVSLDVGAGRLELEAAAPTTATAAAAAAAAAAAPLYRLSLDLAAALPPGATVEPGAVRAKFSKKRRDLTVLLPLCSPCN